jgi:hypothetical protein
MEDADTGGEDETADLVNEVSTDLASRRPPRSRTPTSRKASGADTTAAATQ